MAGVTQGGIILPGMTEPARTARSRGGDFATLEQVNNIVGNLLGPVAITLDEAMGKIARCEDALGITNETVAAEDAAPVGTANRTLILLNVIMQRLQAIEHFLGQEGAGRGPEEDSPSEGTQTVRGDTASTPPLDGGDVE